MRILLDECLPRRFRASLSAGEHECITVPEAGFAGKTNGELLRLAEASFDLFVTPRPRDAVSAESSGIGNSDSRDSLEVKPPQRSNTTRAGLPRGDCQDQTR